PARQLYFPDTAILITRFMTPSGTGEVIDFMPPAPQKQATGNHSLIRMLRCVRGHVEFEFEVAPRFDYGRRAHNTHVTGNGAIFDSRPFMLTLHVVRERDDTQ